jgi:hypothetical protein
MCSLDLFLVFAAILGSLWRHFLLQEYIRPGMRMLFRDGRVRGVGIVTGVPHYQM